MHRHPSRMIVAVLPLLGLLACSTGEADVDAETEGEGTEDMLTAANAGYYALEHDPVASGPGASVRAELPLGRIIVKARMTKRRAGGTTLALLRASEAWRGVTGSPPDGAFYRIGDNGAQCERAPCATISAFELNASRSFVVKDATFDGLTIPADEASLARADAAMWTKDGFLVAASLTPAACASGDASCGVLVDASELYLRVLAEGE